MVITWFRYRYNVRNPSSETFAKLQQSYMYKVGAVSRTVIIQLRFMQIEVSSTKYIHKCIVRKEALEEKLGYKYALYRQ